MMLMNKKSKKKATPASSAKMHVKRGDTVMVIAGRDKGKTGTVKRVFPDQQKVIVEGVNIVKKAVKPNPFLGLQGGIVPMEAPMPASKVMVQDLKAGKPTRVGRKEVNGKRVRVAKRSGDALDE